VNIQPLTSTAPVRTASASRRAGQAAEKPPSDGVQVSGVTPLETPKKAVETLLESFGYVEFPQVSPDGKKLVFNVVGNYATSQMFIMDSDGGSVRSLFSGEKVKRKELAAFLASHEGKIAEQATWSEDGRHLYFRTNEKGTFGIGSYDLKHERSEVVFHDPKLNLKHPVEADNGWIVCYGGPPDRARPTVDRFTNLIMAHPETGQSRTLTNSRGEFAYKHPSMMDGQIVAHKEPKDGSERPNADLVTIDPKTGRERPLTQTPDMDERHPFHNEKRDLLVYHRRKDGDKNLVISTPDGQRSVQLTFDGRPCQSPCWSPDGKSIFFVKKGTKPEEGRPFYERQADIRKLDVKAALEDLKDQAKARLKGLEKAEAGEELVAQARQELDDYRYFLKRY